MLNGMPGLTAKKSNPLRKGWLAGIFILIPLLLAGLILLKISSSKPREAPEAERVLKAQAELPFQVLIPAYMPKLFNREKVQILTDRPGPNGEKMIQLVYSTRRGDSLTLSEWLPVAEGSRKVANVARCTCLCQANQQCKMVGMELNVGSVRIKVEFSTPNLIYRDEMQYLLQTLGPATNRQLYSSIEEVPLSFSVPPPVEIPVGSDGVQEVTLVVSPEGYSPVHFAVKKDVPVRLIFRQLGQVGCGNELIVQLETRKSAKLILASETDKKVLEFTPGEAGEFAFNCPHLIYRGLMTVTD
ncbi:MAG TPA: hypothetical protein VLE49_00330 [Anaerolineales bacterium]|nr:hypothetical protein [Anaerolineales bacterium]